MASKLSPAPKRGPAPKGQPKPVGGNKPSSGSKSPAKRSSSPGPVSSVSVRVGQGSKAIEKSVSVREIENGYLTTESTYGPKGYSDRTIYSKSPPKIDVAAIAKSRK